MKTKKETIVITVVLIGVLVAVLVGATVLYNYWSKRAGPAELPLLTSPGQQNDPNENPPSIQQTEEPQGPANDLDGNAESPPAYNGTDETEDQPTEDVRAPDFTVQDSNGNDVKLSDMQGKPVVLNFWASWCPPCKGEMPEFDKVFNELGEDVHFMMVCLVDGSRETTETGAAFIEDSGYTFPVYYDVSMEATIEYQVGSIPTTYFINAEGYLITGAQGAINEPTLRLGIKMIS